MLRTYAFAAVRGKSNAVDDADEFISLVEIAGTVDGVEHLIDVINRNGVTFVTDAPVKRIIQVCIEEVNER